MKKLAAISLLALFLFNLAGYRIWFYCVQRQSDARVQASIDRQAYRESDLLTLSIPLSMPYQTDRQDFEKIEGEVSFNGKVYKYVERKVSGGMLILRCLPDEQKTRIESALQAYTGWVNDMGGSADHSKKSGQDAPAPQKQFHSDYTWESLFSLEDPLLPAVLLKPAQNDLSITSVLRRLPEQPPEQLL